MKKKTVIIIEIKKIYFGIIPLLIKKLIHMKDNIEKQPVKEEKAKEKILKEEPNNSINNGILLYPKNH